MMPRLNGIQAIEKINTCVRETQIEPAKVFFLTAHKTRGLEKFIIDRLNASAVYEKPLSAEQVAGIFGLQN